MPINPTPRDPKTRKKQRGVQFSDYDWDRINEEAERLQTSNAEVIRRALDKYFHEGQFSRVEARLKRIEKMLRDWGSE